MGYHKSAKILFKMYAFLSNFSDKVFTKNIYTSLGLLYSGLLYKEEHLSSLNMAI